MTLILSQFDGTILRQDKFSFQPEVPKEELIEEIAAHTQTLISDLGDKEILGIGIGDPAHDPTGYQSGHSLHINYSHFNDWVHFGLKPRLEALTGLRVETYSPVTLPASQKVHRISFVLNSPTASVPPSVATAWPSVEQTVLPASWGIW